MCARNISNVSLSFAFSLFFFFACLAVVTSRNQSESLTDLFSKIVLLLGERQSYKSVQERPV